MPEEFLLLLGLGIGLTDVAKNALGSDADLPGDAFDRMRLHVCMAEIRPGCLAFNGKKAASMALGWPTRAIPYGPVQEVPGWPPIVVLPSTSGAGSGYWDPSPWHALARQVANAR